MSELAPTAPWSSYRHPNIWPQSSGRVFMAEAVQIVGAANCQVWDQETPLWMQNELLPEVPPVYEAFDENGAPIVNVHRAYADVVRSITSPATFAVEMLSEMEWVRSCVPNPDGGNPIPELLLRAKAGEDRNDPVTRAHWDAVSCLAAETREKLFDAQSRLELVARTLQAAILEGRVKSSMRLIGGNMEGVEEMPTSRWELDEPLPRLGWCGLHINAPTDPSAVPSHWIFVDRALLMKEVEKLEPVEFFDPGPPQPKPLGYSEQIIEDVSSFLISAFETTGPETRKADYLAAVVEHRGSEISETNWRAAWKLATAQAPERRKPGRPRTRSS